MCNGGAVGASMAAKSFLNTLSNLLVMARLLIVLAIIISLLFLSACTPQTVYVCSDGATAPSPELCPNYGVYVQDFALTLPDLPEGFFIDEEETGVQFGSEIHENDLARGWKEGYFCGFVKPDEQEQIIEEAIYCFISRYDPQGLVGIFDMIEINQSLNMTPFDVPVIGDDRRGYYTYDAESDVVSYTVELVKEDIYAGVTVQHKGMVDMTQQVIEYAQRIESKINK